MLRPFKVEIDQQQIGSPHATPSALPAPISSPASPAPLTPHGQAATKWVDRLFDLLPPQDVGDPHAFIAATVALFAAYPQEVMAQAAHTIPTLTDRPTLKFIREALEDIYAPIERRLQRERAEREHRLALPPPRDKRTPEDQARVDALVADARAKLGAPKPKPWIPPEPRIAAGYVSRTLADIEINKARRASSTDICGNG